ncbi:MAG: hypothetical protein J0L54_08235 [Chitinophagales bacterium]|nr:hypothetical protein [Chitinophagales bacterium]
MFQIKNLHVAVFLLITNISSCAQSKVADGEIVLVTEDSLHGFCYPYFLFMPDKMDSTRQVTIIVEPNNTSFTSDDFTEHIKRAKELCAGKGYMGNHLSVNLQYPLLVPVFPRSKTDWLIYTHSLDRDVMMQKGNSLHRLDLQLIAMIEDCKKKLEARGFKVKERVFMTGFSASSMFVERFTAIHPDKVKASAVGGLNGLLFMPFNKLNNQELNYPIGTNDFSRMFGKLFDSASFKKVPQFFFMGAKDENDAVPYKDGYEDNDRKIIYEQLGQVMMPDRWKKCMDIYIKAGMNATFRTYQGVAHKFNRKNILEDILSFIKQNDGK